MSKQVGLLFISRLDACYDLLTPTEKKIANYMREHLAEIPEESAQSIADKSGTGVASVMRFCKSCGFSGLMELKISLKRETVEFSHLADTDLKRSDSVALIKQKVQAYHIVSIESMANAWDEDELEKACEAIMKAGIVAVCGAGASRTSAYLLQDALHMLGIQCRFNADPVDEAYQIGSMGKGDVMVGFTYSGKFRNTLEAFKLARERGVTTIGILGTAGSPCSEYADIILYSQRTQKKFYFGTQSNVIGDFFIIETIYSIIAARKTNLSEAETHLINLIDRLRVQ